MNYQLSILAPATPEEAFDALTDGISSWWTTHFTGSGRNVGDEFSVTFDGTSKKFKVSEVQPLKKIVWECLEAYIDASGLKNRSEWLGTHMIWTIEPEGGMVRLTMTHEGLTPKLECYDICEQGWQYFILESLQPMLQGKKPQPFRHNALVN